MIDKYYKTISLYRYKKGGFDTKSGYELEGTFQGLIQSPSNSKTFNNGKDTSNVSGILFCSNHIKFEEKDIVEYNGQKFIISGQNTQTDGVTGIIPKQGQHSEYSLQWTQQGI